MTTPAYALRDGNSIPAIGLGTFGLDDQAGIDAITTAIADGYRLIDTAYNYGNEEAVGRGDPSHRRRPQRPAHHHQAARPAPRLRRDHRELRAVARKLDLDWVDLYLIHWPLPRVDKYVESWRAMISLREKGLVRSIGVSNFTADMLTRLIDETSVVPVVNQVELHPYFPQAELRAFHDEHEIRTESWSPLAKRSELLQEPVIAELAAAHGVTPAQVVLRWHIELGAVPIPKSSDAARRRANLDVFGFALATEEVDAISALSRGRLWGADPDTHEEF